MTYRESKRESTKYGPQGIERSAVDDAVDGVAGRPIEPVAYRIRTRDGMRSAGWFLLARSPPRFEPLLDDESDSLPVQVVAGGEYRLADVQPLSDVLGGLS